MMTKRRPIPLTNDQKRAFERDWDARVVPSPGTSGIRAPGNVPSIINTRRPQEAPVTTYSESSAAIKALSEIEPGQTITDGRGVKWRLDPQSDSWVSESGESEEEVRLCVNYGPLTIPSDPDVKSSARSRKASDSADSILPLLGAIRPMVRAVIDDRGIKWFKRYDGETWLSERREVVTAPVLIQEYGPLLLPGEDAREEVLKAFKAAVGVTDEPVDPSKEQIEGHFLVRVNPITDETVPLVDLQGLEGWDSLVEYVEAEYAVGNVAPSDVVVRVKWLYSKENPEHVFARSTEVQQWPGQERATEVPDLITAMRRALDKYGDGDLVRITLEPVGLEGPGQDDLRLRLPSISTPLSEEDDARLKDALDYADGARTMNYPPTLQAALVTLADEVIRLRGY